MCGTRIADGPDSGNFRDNIWNYNGALAMASFAVQRWRCLPVSCMFLAVLLPF